MAQRKQTPNILDDILGGGQARAEVPQTPPAPLSTKSKSSTQTGMKTVKKPQKSAPTVKQPSGVSWQYLVASFQDYKGWRLRFVDGVEVPNWTHSPLLHEYIQQLAAQGWELVSSAAGERLYGITDKHQLYLRRRQES